MCGCVFLLGATCRRELKGDSGGEGEGPGTGIASDKGTC